MKKLVWEGQTQQQVADDHMISISMVAKIVAGRAWYDIPWPDGSLGALSEEQRGIISTKRQRETFVAKKGGRRRSKKDSLRLINTEMGRERTPYEVFMATERWVNENTLETREQKQAAWDLRIKEESEKRRKDEEKRKKDYKKWLKNYHKEHPDVPEEPDTPEEIQEKARRNMFDLRKRGKLVPELFLAAGYTREQAEEMRKDESNFNWHKNWDEIDALLKTQEETKDD
jgi:hypothetical protein